MKKIFLILALGILLLNSVLAFSICIDKDPPSLMDSSLSWTATSDTIQLSWTPAIDIPSCSGIDYYDIYRSSDGVNFLFIGSSQTNSYTDSEVSSGKGYYYIIHAFDLVGQNEAEEGLSNSAPISLASPSAPGTSEGGGGSSGGGGGDNFFSCGDWGECIDGNQTRVCEEINGNLPNRTETKSCFAGFTPLGYENDEFETPLINQESISSTNLITGAVTGITDFVKKRKGTSFLVGLIVIVAGAIIFVRRHKS